MNYKIYQFGTDGAFSKPRYGETFYPLSTAREWDSEANQYYYRARYYTPQVGRFNQRDKIGYGSIGLYTYVLNNSINLADPSGNTEVRIYAGGIGKGSSGIPKLGLGHASVKLDDGTYISFYPAVNNGIASINVPATTNTEAEDSGEYAAYSISCLNEAAMKNEWQKIKNGIADGSITFSSIGNNCSTIAARVIAAGMDKTKPNCPKTEIKTWKMDNCNNVIKIIEWELKSCFNSDSGGIPGVDTPANLAAAVECLIAHSCKNYYCESKYSYLIIPCAVIPKPPEDNGAQMEGIEHCPRQH